MNGYFVMLIPTPLFVFTLLHLECDKVERELLLVLSLAKQAVEATCIAVDLLIARRVRGTSTNTSARGKRENKREARTEKSPPVVTLLFMLYRLLK